MSWRLQARRQLSHEERRHTDNDYNRGYEHGEQQQLEPPRTRTAAQGDAHRVLILASARHQRFRLYGLRGAG